MKNYNLTRKDWTDIGKSLGIDTKTKKLTIPQDFPSVLVGDKWTPARQVMKDNGFIADAVPVMSNVNINQINSLAIDNVFLGWGELSLLQQNTIIQNICAIFAESMTEKWINFTTKDIAKQEKIKQLEEHIKKFKLKDKMGVLIYKSILLGTMYISPKIKGDEEDLQKELILDGSKIEKGSLEELYLIEPTWVVPLEFNMRQPRAKNFYKPQSYVVFGETLHASRMTRFIMIEPVNLLSPMYLFGGIPPIQLWLPYILDFLNTKKQVVQIISRFNLNVVKTNMNTLHGTDGFSKANTQAGKLKGRAEAFNALRNNFGVLFLDATEEFIQIQIPLNGLTDVLQQQAEFLSLFTRLPISKLFGQAPRGMNATGEYDANQFNELIHTLQESKLRPDLDYCIKVLQLDLWGEIDEEISFDFVPLGELNETTQSQLKNDKVNRLTQLTSSGILAPNSVKDLIMQDPELELHNYDDSQEPTEEELFNDEN
jgi:hypothetical protein